MAPASRIRVLSEETVNRVAAGEVVERPAAALKELLENSLDAGAGVVAIELQRAGKGLIRIADDGCGMGHDELLLALERHATSKIATAEDLARVSTYGFRGEALPSIAAVSRLRVDTRERGAPQGTRLVADAGRILSVVPCGCPEGTQVEVRDLFRPLPARLKFLRTDETELGHCVQVVARLALACPGVGFSLRHGDRELLRVPPAPDAASRLRAMLDREFFSGLVPLRRAAGQLSVSGFVSRPGSGRRGPDYQQLFVNGRPVRDPLLAQALREAGADYVRQEAAGLSWYLWISLPADELDVNVHPTKREVRFRDLGAVRGLVGAALREALRADRAAPLAALVPAPALAGLSPPLPRLAPELAAEPPPAVPYAAQTPLQTASAPAASPAPAPVGSSQLFGTYLVCPGPEGLVLVDQHAAHERVLYERFLARTGASSQQLLEPLVLECSPTEEQALQSVRPALASVGVAVEPFGPRAWRVSALPPELPPREATALLRQLVALALQEGAPPRVEEFRHRAAAALACHAAVRANRRLGAAETAALLADLARCENPAACPHGRPTAITIDRAEIERRFKRG